MGRAPCCEKVGLNRGPWTSEEDRILIDHINQNGHANWRKLPKKAGLLRCGKSCRLRWINYLRPDVKRGDFTKEEEDTLIKLQQKLGHKWSAIAKLMPGRTDNEIKNVWNTHLKKMDDNIITKKRPRKRSKIIQKVVTQNNDTPHVQNNVQDSTSSDGKSSNNHVIVEATSELTNIIGDQNSSSSSSSSVSKDTITNHNGGTSTCATSSEISDSLSKFLEIEDDFSWPDVMSTPSFDGNLHDDEMEFWYGLYTRDGSIEDLLQNS